MTATATVGAARGVEIQTELAEGLPIGLVYVHLAESTGDPAKDERMKSRIADAFGVGKGETFRRIIVDFGLNRVRQLDSVQSAELKCYETLAGGQVVAALLVTPATESTAALQKREGLLSSRNIRDFPTIFETDRSKFVFILNGGTGVFSDTDSWFGGFGEAFNGSNPTAEEPLDAETSTWIEGYIEPGFGGIFQLSDYPVYPYGAASYLMSGTDGHDIYNSGSWGHGDFEKLYGTCHGKNHWWTFPSASRSINCEMVFCYPRYRFPRPSASAPLCTLVLA